MAPQNQPMTLRNEPMDGRPLMRKGPIGAPKPGSTAERLLKHRERVNVDAQRRAAKRAELATNAELTDLGKANQALAFSVREVATSNLKGRRDLAKLEKEIAAKEAGLQMPKGDPNDLAGLRRRFRMCDRLVNMAAEERHKYAMKHRDDPNFQLALIEAREDGEELGISETLVGQILDGVKLRLNGPLVEEIQYDKRV